MRKLLGGFIVALCLTVSIPVSASELGFEQCPDSARPIHYPPLCLTEAEYLALTSPPTQTIAPTPVYVAPEVLVRTIAYYFWPDWAAERMVRISKCETVPDYNPNSYNPRSGASGLWQIMPGWQRTWPGDYFDPWTNGAVAYQIWLVQGFSAWVCRG